MLKQYISVTAETHKTDSLFVCYGCHRKGYALLKQRLSYWIWIYMGYVLYFCLFLPTFTECGCSLFGGFSGVICFICPQLMLVNVEFVGSGHPGEG